MLRFPSGSLLLSWLRVARCSGSDNDKGSARSQEPVEYLHMVQGKDLNFMGVVHGGVIMTAMDEAAGVAAYRYARLPMWTVAVDDLSLTGACKAGDLLIVRARVVHASARALEVLVEVEAEELFSGERRRTNSGRITFVTADPQAVLPPFEPRDNEEDRRLFEEARRRHQERRSRKRQ